MHWAAGVALRPPGPIAAAAAAHIGALLHAAPAKAPVSARPDSGRAPARGRGDGRGRGRGIGGRGFGARPEGGEVVENGIDAGGWQNAACSSDWRRQGHRGRRDGASAAVLMIAAAWADADTQARPQRAAAVAGVRDAADAADAAVVADAAASRAAPGASSTGTTAPAAGEFPCCCCCCR